MFSQFGCDGVGEGWADDEAVADAHVEDAIHLGGVDGASFLEEGEDGGDGPGALEDGVGLGREGAGEVGGEAAAGDVGHAADDLLDLIGPLEADNGACVDAGGFEEDLAEGFLFVEFGVGLVELEAFGFDDLADEGVAVGVDAAGGEGEDDVTGFYAEGVDGAGELDDADGEAGEVVVAWCVDGGHLRGFAAEEGTAGLLAAVCDALDDAFDVGGIDVVDADVVEEEEGFSALDEHVVDAHGDEVDADGVVDVELGGELDLGADAIGAGDEDGVLVVAFEELLVVVEAEEACEAAGVGDDALALGAAEVAEDELCGLVAGVDIHAGVGVGQSVGGGGVLPGHRDGG